MTAKRDRQKPRATASSSGGDPSAASAAPPPSSSTADRGGSAELFRGIVEEASELIYRIDGELRFAYLNPAAHRLTGHHPHELVGTPLLELVREDHRTRLEVALRELATRPDRPPEYIEFPIVTATGEERWIGQHTHSIPADAGASVVQAEARDVTTDRETRETLAAVLSRPEYFGHDALLAVARDVSDQNGLQHQSERLAALSRENPNPALECDAAGQPVHVNPAAEAIARELGLTSVEELLPSEHRNLVAHALERGEGFHDVEAFAGDRIFEWTYRPHAASGVVHLFASEVTGRRETEERLRHHALHDPVTDLPNRLLFLERLEHAVQLARRHERWIFAILFLDLDRFKVVNDSLGHHIGDELLTAVADRLRGSVRMEDTVARFGGDEFAVLVENIEEASDAIRVAERIHEALAEPLHLEGYDLVVSCSVGIALGSSAEIAPGDLLRNADVAMYRAKAMGPGRFEVFDPEMHVAALDRLQVESDLRTAEDRGELLLHFQPIIDLADGQLAGVEALLRWSHPERGLLLPEFFIPLAEEMGMIRSIGGWVLRSACAQLASWRDRYGAAAPGGVAVNVSAQQFVDGQIVQQVRAALDGSGLPGEALCLEITESAMMENLAVAAALLSRVKTMGVQVCVDDFGTGYSSLSYLHRFPLDRLKIDRSFVHRMTEDQATLQLVRTMMTLARSLDARSVAEGVETEPQLALLRTIGAEYAQGYLIGRPMDPPALEALMAVASGQREPSPE